MNLLHSIFFRLNKLFRPHSSTSELDDELQFHIDMSVQQKMAEGMSREEAEREAKREFGSDLRVREDCRMSWGTRLVDETVQDVKRAARRLWKRPSYSVPVVVILAVALGACATFLDILYQRAFRPYPEANKIVEIGTSYANLRYANSLRPLSDTAFECVQGMPGIFESIGQCGSDGYFLKIGEQTEYVHVSWMTAGMWEAMQLEPLYGRAFTQQDIDEGNLDVAVVTYYFAQKRFGSIANALNKNILLSGKYFRIIGILEKGTRFPISTKIAIPYRSDFSGRYGNSRMTVGKVFGRLNSNVSLEQLEVRLPSVMERIKELDQQFQSYSDKFSIKLKVRRYLDSFRVRYKKLGFLDLVFILTALAFLLFLIANMNWLSVLRTNLVQNMRNTGIRFALGAPKNRMFRSLFIENLLLLTVALFAGFFMSGVLHSVINQWRLFEQFQILQHGFGYYAMMLLVGFSLILSLPLVLHYLKSKNVQKYLQERQSTSSASSKSLFLLSLLQTFFCTILLLISIVLALNISRILNADYGFKDENRLIAAIQIPAWKQKLSLDGKLQLLKSVKEGVSKTPGFKTVSFCSTLPQSFLFSQPSFFTFDVGKFPAVSEKAKAGSETRLRFSINMVDEDFKEAIGLQLLAGRWFLPSDTLSDINEVVLEEGTAKMLFGDESPVGFQFYGDGNQSESGSLYQIIGVVNDVGYGGSQRRVEYERFNAYLHYGELSGSASWPRDYALVCEIPELKQTHFEDLRTAIREVDPNLGLKMASYRQDIRDKYDTILVMSRVALAMSAVTLFVTGYGFLSFLYYKTHLMKKEFAIRLSLGAGKSRMIRRYMLKQSIPVVLGTLLGVCVLIAVMGRMEAIFSEVSRFEVFPYGIVIAGMTGFLGLSALFPLWQMRKLELREILQGE